MQRLEIEQRSGRDGALVLAPRGPIRARNFELFREHVDAQLEQGAHLVVVDCKDVEYLDSSTAGYLLMVHDRLKARLGGLALARLSTGVRVVIDSIGLTSFFSVADTVDEAIAALHAD